ncbi:MAG: hypothetical protein SOX43_08040, partial [Pelistega sp.]|nr:hypothetical protein [Pelistega sp.]
MRKPVQLSKEIVIDASAIGHRSTSATTQPVVQLQPENQGLYNKEMEHDACGVGFVANIKGKKSHT